MCIDQNAKRLKCATYLGYIHFGVVVVVAASDGGYGVILFYVEPFVYKYSFTVVVVVVVVIIYLIPSSNTAANPDDHLMTLIHCNL